MLKALQEPVWFEEFSLFTLRPKHMVSISGTGWRWDLPSSAQWAPLAITKGPQIQKPSSHFSTRKPFNCLWNTQRDTSTRPLKETALGKEVRELEEKEGKEQVIQMANY